MLRSEWNTAPGPPFSPLIWRAPCRLGISKSCFQNSNRPNSALDSTKSAPSSASPGSVEQSSTTGAPADALSFAANW